MDSDSSLEVQGTDGTQDVPRKWEGFGEYKLLYRLRDEGLDFLGNDSVVRHHRPAHTHVHIDTHVRILTINYGS